MSIIKTKICPKCGQANVLRAVYCTRQGCGYVFPDESSESGENLSPDKTPKEQPIPPVVTGQDDAPIIEFETLSVDIVNRIKEEIGHCNQSQKAVAALKKNTDEAIRKTYERYKANFEIMDSSMKRIEQMARELDAHYTTAKSQLSHNLPARQKLLLLAYEEKKSLILPLVKQLVDAFINKKPFDLCRGHQISPLGDWNDIPAPLQIPQHFLYLGKIHRQYNILGQQFYISRREYLELLNAQNLIIHFNNKSKDKATTLVSTLLSRMLKATEGQLLHISVIDPKMGMGLNKYFKTGLPKSIYTVDKGVDTTDLLERELQVLQMTGGDSAEIYNQSRHAGEKLLDYQVVVFQDWRATLNNRIDKEDILDIVTNSVNAGYCFIFMVNDDNNLGAPSSRRQDEDDLLLQLPYREVIDLQAQWINDSQQLELMNENQIFDILKDVRNHITPYSKDIDVGVLLEEQKAWGTASCQDGFSLFIGKDDSLQDIAIEFKDDIIHQSMMVNYRGTKSKAFPWVNALIAQAFTLYDPEELNILVADFIGISDLAALVDMRVLLEPPFYYLGGTSSQPTPSKERIGNQLPRIFSSLTSDSQKRLLAFIIGKEEDIKKYVIDKFHLKKDRLHLVLLTTEFVIDTTRKQRDFEGYQLSFGPMRIENASSRFKEEEITKSVSGDEFLFEGHVCQAYTYSIEKTSQVIRPYIQDINVLPSPEQDQHPEDNSNKPVKNAFEEKTPETVNPVITKVEHTPSSSTNITEKKQKATESVDKQRTVPGLKERIEIAAKETHLDKSVVEKERKNVTGPCVKPDQKTNKVILIEEKFDYQRVFPFREQMLPESEWWKESCNVFIEIPFGIHINREIGDKDETRSLWFENKESMANAALVLGGTGSGKTTFLQTLILNAALRYSPKELEFYLIDFKKVGFLPFEKYKLPHARVVAGGADREFGLSILEKLEEELKQRMDNPGNYPRTILIIDECQDFFLNDKIAEEATRILESIVRRGGKFGINIILATQELHSNTTSIPSSLYDNIAIRIVAKPKPTDYYGLFDRTSSSEMETLKKSYKTGELLYVTDTYMSSRASIEDYHAKSFYIQYDEKDPDNSELKEILEQLARFAAAHEESCPNDKGMFVFHNDAPLVKFSNTRMKDEHRRPSDNLPGEIPMYLGIPIAIDSDVYLTLTQERNQNILVIGASDAPVGQGIALNALISSLSVYPEGKRIDYVFDFTKKGEPLYGQLEDVVKIPPFNPQSEVIPNKEKRVVEKLQEIKALLEERTTHPQDEVDSHVFLTIFGLDKGIMFGVDPSNTGGYFESYLEATTLLNYIICNGPQYGVFTMVQFSSRLGVLSQMLNIGSGYSLFSHVVALQLEESESMTLMNESQTFLYNKSAARKNPGLYRALYYDRSNPNFIQKFKPYKF